MLECNIDDMSSEIYSYLIDKLFENNVKDVSYTSVFMKKNRPGIKISILVDEKDIESIERILFLETTTFGIRKYKVDRSILERKFSNVMTKYGEFSLKLAYFEGECIKATAEYEECKMKALEYNISIREVYNFINAYIENEIIK